MRHKKNKCNKITKNRDKKSNIKKQNKKLKLNKK